MLDTAYGTKRERVSGTLTIRLSPAKGLPQCFPSLVMGLIVGTRHTKQWFKLSLYATTHPPVHLCACRGAFHAEKRFRSDVHICRGDCQPVLYPVYGGFDDSYWSRCGRGQRDNARRRRSAVPRWNCLF